MSELEKCPFHGHHPAGCDCLGHLKMTANPKPGIPFTDETWQSRPLESAARAEGYREALEDVYAKLRLNEERKYSDLELRQAIGQLKSAYEKGSDGNGKDE